MESTIGLASLFVFAAAVAAAQEKAATRPAWELKEPLTDQAKVLLDEEDRLVVRVERAPEESESETRPAADRWRITLSGRGYAADPEGMALLQSHLAELGKARTRKARPDVSERGLLIRADADAPYGHVQKILEAAAGARIYRISMAASGGALEIPLPIDEPPGSVETRSREAPDGPPVIQVVLAWSKTARRVARLYGKEQFVPPTPEGDRQLESLIKTRRDQIELPGRSDVRLMISSGPGVPWQFVVDVLSVARRAGIQKVEFGFGGAPPK